MWKRFLGEHKWYIFALCVALFITLLALYVFFGMREISAVRSQNAARADSLNADIEALPKVELIIPAKTSGMTDYVSTARSSLAMAIEAEYTPRYASWVFFAIPSYYAENDAQSLHKKLAADVSSRLKATAQDLTSLKKFIEYMPLVDLQEDAGDDTGRGERLSRTKQGIDEAIAYLQWTTLPNKSTLITQLTELNKNTLALTNETKGAWAQKILDVQTLLLKDIHTQDIQQSALRLEFEGVHNAY